MNLPLNPENIINNLNNNFNLIVGNAVIGYIKFYNYEQEFLSSIPIKLNIQDLQSKPEVMNFLIAYANYIQHGKSYFLNEITFNYIQMKNLSNYINIFTPHLPTSTKRKSSISIEDLDNKDEQKGGFSFVKYFASAIVGFLITCLDNTTAVSNAISPAGLVSLSVNLETGEMPKAVGFQEDLDPMNETSIIEFTKQYNPSAKFPEDREMRVNITEGYEKEYIEKLKQGMNMFKTFVTPSSSFHSSFLYTVKNETDKINQFTSLTHTVLEDLCRSFTKTTDPKLPIPIFELLNSKMASKLEELQEKSKKLIAEKESQLRKQKIEELQITAPEPSIVEIATSQASSVTTKLSNLLWNPFSTKKTEEPVVPKEVSTQPSTEELVEMYDEVDRTISEEIALLSQQIQTEAFQTLANDVISGLNVQAAEALKVTNLRIYLTAICHIKKPKYTFNETTGELFIRDPAKTRTHLMVLAKNVVSYYDTVLEGLSYIKDGEILIDTPDEPRRINMKSLREKSYAIIEILTTYDTELARTLSSNEETDVNNFFKNIASMWINLKNEMINALVQFPITERESRKEIERQKEETKRKLIEEQRNHELRMLERIQNLAQNQQLNNITQEEWNVFNKYFSISSSGALGTGTALINNIVNATSDIGDNVLDNIEKLREKGFASITKTAWGIVLLSTLTAFPIILFLSLKTGLISAVFRKIKRSVDDTTTPSVTTIIEPPVPVVQPPVAPFQSTELVVIPDFTRELREEYGDETVDELIFTLQNLDVETTGGRRYNRKRQNRKTRKNKKLKTRKLKHGKKRHTKNKRQRPTRRH